MAPEQTESAQSIEELSELKRTELDELAAQAGVADPDQLPNKWAVAEAIVAAREQEPADEPEPEEPKDEPEPEEPEEQESTPIDTSNPSGEYATVTYLGRPEMVARGEEGELLEEDVYQGTDPWDENRPVNLSVGESGRVSAEKAAQLEADFPDAFEIS